MLKIGDKIIAKNITDDNIFTVSDIYKKNILSMVSPLMIKLDYCNPVLNYTGETQIDYYEMCKLIASNTYTIKEDKNE